MGCRSLAKQVAASNCRVAPRTVLLERWFQAAPGAQVTRQRRLLMEHTTAVQMGDHQGRLCVQTCR